MDFYALFVRFIADYIVFIIVAVGAWTLLRHVPNDQKFRAYCRILMAGVTALMFAKLLSVTWQPTAARPYILMGIEPGGSVLDNLGFPSDHTLFVTAIVIAVWAETRRRWETVILAVMAVAVYFGRVLAFVHTPLDILGGILVALLGGLWYFQRDTAPKIVSTKTQA